MSYGKFLEDSGTQPKVYIPVKQSINEGTQSSEVTTQDLLNPDEINETAPVVESFPLMDHNQLKNEIEISKEFHLRPMSDLEYQKYIDILKSGIDKGQYLFKHDLAAISRVIKENFYKWQPNIELDPVVDDSLGLHYEVDSLLSSHYDNALDKYRTPFMVSKPEEVSQLYSQDEIQRFRNLGIAFLGDEFREIKTLTNTESVSQPNTVNVNANKNSNLSVPLPKALQYTHPMLKYGVLKK